MVHFCLRQLISDRWSAKILQKVKLVCVMVVNINNLIRYTFVSFSLSFSFSCYVELFVTTDYLWVEGDVCEVSMQLINPLPFELHVSNMRLLTNGVVFESIPESISLPAESGPIAVTLAGRPKEIGDLEILGFSTHTLGVKSNCRLRHMEGMLHPQYTVEVIPALPRIDVATSLPQTASFSSGDNIVTSASISLYGGERFAFIIIKNSPIDVIIIFM